MKSITLSVLTMAAVAASAVAAAGAQNPTPPVAPVAPVVPAPTPHPAIAPRPLTGLEFENLRDISRDMARDVTREMGRFDRESIDASLDAAREATRAAMRDNREAMESAREATRAALADAREQMRFDSRNNWNFDRQFGDLVPTPMPLPAIAPMPALAPMPPLPEVGAIAPRAFGFGISDGLRVHMPPAPWAQGDPADSLYRLARNSLNGGEYGRAAKLFAEIAKSYPKSAYQSDAVYYEAWARYKIGTTDELKQAAKLLDPIVSKVGNGGGPSGSTNVGFNYDSRRGTSDAEVSALYYRINGALAQRGDRDAAAIVSKAASTPGAPCDQEDLQVRTEALNALSQMDPGAALPLIHRVLDHKDDCSAPLRRSAVFMLARRGDNESATLLMQEAKSDPSISVRTEAINFLPRIPGDAGLNALEEMLRSDTDERVQRAAVHALVSSDNAKARASMRSLIDRKDAPLNLRVEAISSFNSEHATPDDAKYLRDLYGRADNDRLKSAIIDAVGRIGGNDSDQWLLAIARNQNETSQLRSTALGRFTRSNTVSVADLSKLYDSADSYELRTRVINMLSVRKEPEATDKLIDIVKTSTVVGVRTQAINALTRKNDPRATQLLMDILDGKRS